jgi:hypothetical protein
VLLWTEAGSGQTSQNPLFLFMIRKLPSAQKVDRLYWLEEWTQRRIARKYHCSPQNVYLFMKRHAIRTRPRRNTLYGLEQHAECIIEGCEEPTCQIKRWKQEYKYGFKFIWTIRCAKHHHEWWCQQQRQSKRKREGFQGIARAVKSIANLGTLSIIAREGS